MPQAFPRDPVAFQREFAYTYAMAPISDVDLVRSLRRVGPLLPLFRVGSRVLDGQRRAEICKRHRITLPVREVKLVDEAHLLWVLHPERITRDKWPDPATCAAAVLSEPGTIAAHWTSQEMALGSRWQRLARSFRAALHRAAEGGPELTPQMLVGIVRRTL